MSGWPMRHVISQRVLLPRRCSRRSISKYQPSSQGVVYRLLKDGVSERALKIQQQLLDVAPEHNRLASVTASHLTEMDTTNASTALHLLAQHAGLSMEDKALASPLVEKILGDPKVQPRDVALAAWSLARLAVKDEVVLAALASAVRSSMDELNGQDAAQVAWAFATLQTAQGESLLSDVANSASRRLDDFSPRHVVGVLWALGAARVRNEDYCWAAAAVTESTKANQWVSQDVANFLWAFAVLGCEAPPPLVVIVSCAAELGWRHFQPQELSTCMWAAMTLGRRDPRPAARSSVQRLLQHAARELRDASRVQQLECQHLANVAWALARWQRHCRFSGWPQACKPATVRPVLRALAKEAAPRLSEFGSRELSRFIWALGAESCLHIRLLAPPLLQELRRPKRLRAWDCDELVSVSTALAWAHERLFWEPRAVCLARRSSDS